MSALSWNPETLIARRDGMHSLLAEVIAAAKRSDGVSIRMERSKSRPILGSPGCVAASKAQFREGCVKAVELGMQPLPQKARILSEIHRRIDLISETSVGSGSWQSSLASIMDFTGAWALAAWLMREGLSVLVHEESVGARFLGSIEEGRADVELVIPIGSA
jgi:hypothetical protein